MTFSFQGYGEYKKSDVSSTIKQRDYKEATDLVVRQAVMEGMRMEDRQTVVRRLTPMECERLQGFPDNWTLIGKPDDINGDYWWTDSTGKRRKVTDSARYKALGNSIAVGYANRQSGFWMILMKRISAQYERSATLGSLFDGIGGFPLAWETYNGKGSAIWASEVEEFAIAVTKEHFPEGEEEKYLDEEWQDR